MPGPDPDGQVSLMLCESILHILVEEGVISRGRRSGPRSDASYTGRSATRCIRCISRTGTLTPWISCATRSATIFPSAAGCLPTSARRSMWGSRRGGAAGRAVQPLTSATRGGRCILERDRHRQFPIQPLTGSALSRDASARPLRPQGGFYQDS
jgi:hypothetical protein